jgi:SEC-C motif-containing protein
MTIPTASDACPCASGKSYGDCCSPFLAGTAFPPTAEALMRSRYTAYAVNQVDYIAATDHPTRQGEFDRASATAWATKSQWTGLEIKEVVDGGPADERGTVEFIAHFVLAGKPQQHRERSTFARVDGRWYYQDGGIPAQKPFKNEAVAPGRNDPCHCGSGKKFKKCHGA